MRAQTASELAIFGAVVIFVLGLVVRYATNFSLNQNQSLAAMRWAFKQSFLGSESGSTSRNFASILLIEDRKDVDVGKFGALNRSPYVVSGSGAFTKNLFMIPEWGEWWNLPVMDVFVNGKHFTFTTSGFKTYCFQPPDGSYDCADVDGAEQVRYRAQDWQNACINEAGNPFDGEACPKFFDRIPNLYYIDGSGNTHHVGRYNPGEADRFDLDRCGVADVPAGDHRETFSWQWGSTMAATRTLNLGEQGASYDVDGDLKEEQVLKVLGRSGEEQKLGAITSADACNSVNAPVYLAHVIDSQAGDMDLAYGTYDERGGKTPASGCIDQTPMKRPGLKNDMIFYADTKEGTYFSIEEGKLYEGVGSDRQFIRNVQAHDRVDIIERKFQLSNDTGRLCGNGGDVVDGAPNRGQNPDIEICNDCNNPNNVVDPNKGEVNNSLPRMFRTCFDETTKMLYIRSRIGDISGRKWITDVSGDVNPIK